MTTTEKLTPADLRYAAGARCDCGLGMAYRVECDMGNIEHTRWECSGVLLGTGDTNVLHSPPMPFAFYEVKSEDQPSANGRTTRPAETDDEKASRAAKATRRRLDAFVSGAIKAHDKFVAAQAEAVREIMAAHTREISTDDAQRLCDSVYAIGTKYWLEDRRFAEAAAMQAEETAKYGSKHDV